MELKFSLPSVPILAALGSNRTFMELKFNKRKAYMDALRVLIAPLWN